MKGFATLVLASLLVASGCFGKSSPPPPPGTQTPTVTADTGLNVSSGLPTWVLGQHWTYAIEIPGRPTTQFQMVVAEDEEDLWIVATDDREKALHHALYSTNPVLGRIMKATLSPYQSGEPVEMFRFPIMDRLMWSATFFGETMAFVAEYDEAILAMPNVYLPGYRIVAAGPSGAKVTYNFVDSVKWFSTFKYEDAAGSRQIQLTLQDFGSGYTGQYHFLRGKDQLMDARTESTQPGGQPTFTISADDGFDRLGIGLKLLGLGAQQAVVQVDLKDAGGATAYTVREFLSENELFLDQEELLVGVGTYTLDVAIVGSASVETRVAGLVVHAGTL